MENNRQTPPQAIAHYSSYPTSLYFLYYLFSYTLALPATLQKDHNNTLYLRIAAEAVQQLGKNKLANLRHNTETLYAIFPDTEALTHRLLAAADQYKNSV